MIFKDVLEKVIQHHSLSLEESTLLMEEVMSGRLTPSQIAAFFVALRMKGETIDELAGFASVMRRWVRVIQTHHPMIVDTCGTGGDGAKTFNISTLSALVVAGAGIPVAKHGNAAVSSQCGSADLLKGLGVKVDADRSIMEKALNEIGLCFLFAPIFHHAMKHAATPRREIGVRTAFNILGPLTNPARAKAQVIGVFKKELTELLAQVLLKLGLKQGFVVHGEDGLDEVTTTGKTFVSQLKDGAVTSFIFNPESLGLSKALPSDLKGGDVHRNIEIARDVLEGEKGAPRDVVLLNAAFAIVAGEGASDFAQGLKKAQNSIDSGHAQKKLDQLIEYTKGESKVF